MFIKPGQNGSHRIIEQTQLMEIRYPVPWSKTFPLLHSCHSVQERLGFDISQREKAGCELRSWAETAFASCLCIDPEYESPGNALPQALHPQDCRNKNPWGATMLSSCSRALATVKLGVKALRVLGRWTITNIIINWGWSRRKETHLWVVFGWETFFIPWLWDASSIASRGAQLHGTIQKLPCWTTTCQFFKSRAIFTITVCAA